MTLRTTRFLGLAFAAVLTLRFSVPFLRNPLRLLQSDYRRHWEAAGHPLHPNVIGALDPKLYEFWLGAVRRVTHDNPQGVAFFCGLLSVSFAWFWYRACRELMPRRAALVVSIAVGLMPSMLLCFTRTMNETISLVVLAASLWLSLRAARLGTAGPFLAAAAMVAISTQARMTLAPALLACLLYALAHQQRRLLCTAAAVALSAAVMLPSGWLTYLKLKVFAPIHFAGPNVIYRKAFTTHYRLAIDDEVWVFASPSASVNPLDPIATYESNRAREVHPIRIHTSNGRRDWDEAYEEAASMYGWGMFWSDLRDNIVYFSLGPQWPHAFKDSPDWTERLNYHARWIWPFLILWVLLAAPFARVTVPQQFLLVTTVLMIAMHFFQQSAVTEGRYRLIVEPHILTSALLCLRAIWRPGPASLNGSMRARYLRLRTG